MIDPNLLNEPINRYILAKPEESLGAVIRRLSEANGETWWHLVVELGDKHFAATQFKNLSSLAISEGNAIFHHTISSLVERVPILEVRVVEQTEIGTEAAKDLADESPGQVLVVTQDGEFFRILFRGKAGGSVADGSLLTQFQKALAQTPLAEAPPNLESNSKPEASPEEPASNKSSNKTARFTNACLTHVDHNRVVDKNTELAINTPYALRIDIGPLRKESTISNPAAFRDDLLPQKGDGWWLEAIAVSGDFKIELKQHFFYLPKTGPSWVCACSPGESHRCNPTRQERQEFLYIPLQAPKEVGWKTLRLTIYFNKNAVESFLLRAYVAETERVGKGYSAKIDYTLTARLDDFNFLAPRLASIVVNQNPNGEHRLVINGALDPHTLNLSPKFLNDKINELRQNLKTIHFKNWPLLNPDSRYAADNSKTVDEFKKDLATLAEFGSNLYWAIDKKDIVSIGNNNLTGALQGKSPQIIQIALANTTFIFPWAFLYDIPKDPGSDWQPCKLLQEWDGKSPLISPEQQSCKYAQFHDENTLCPFGFWGYRYELELPPSINGENTDNLKQIIKTTGPLDFLIIENTTLDLEIRKAHFSRLEELVNHPLPPAAKNRSEALSVLYTPAPEIIYFYVHGKRLKKNIFTSTSLLVGNDEEITPHDIYNCYRDWVGKDHWKDSAPLIFINGCHTVDLQPEYPVSFVTEFATASASGVVGTEIPISTRIASEMAELFFGRFLQNISVGKALRSARIDLLNKGNVLGLVYTAYCATELTLGHPDPHLGG